MKTIIDGDIVTFRAAFTAEPHDLLSLLKTGMPEQDALEQVKYEEENGEWIACARADDMLEQMLHEVEATSYEVWLSGEQNFRYRVYPEYKANRLAAKRPKWEHQVKAHLVDKWNANWAHGCEADDMMGVRCTELGDNSIIATIDKDLDMIPGWHYNFVKKVKYYVDPDQAFRFFCYQLMVGDTADGIKGVPGIGPKKAEKFLSSTLPAEWIPGIKDMYSCDEEFEMNAACLYIWRKENDTWKSLML